MTIELIKEMFIASSLNRGVSPTEEETKAIVDRITDSIIDIIEDEINRLIKERSGE